MVLEPVLSQNGIILEPRWSCLSKGGDISQEVFTSARTERKHGAKIAAAATSPSDHNLRRIPDMMLCCFSEKVLCSLLLLRSWKTRYA